MEVPLAVTLALEENAAAFFTALRKIYNKSASDSAAYIPLFQLLPNEASITEPIANICQQVSPFQMQVLPPEITEEGVVYLLKSEKLYDLHQLLQAQWSSVLLPEDAGNWKAQIIIQEKTTTTAATELLEFLQNFSMSEVQATGLQLWTYGHQGILQQTITFGGKAG